MFALSCFSQQTPTASNAKIDGVKALIVSPKDKFKQDLQSKKLTVYLMGGIVSVIKEKDLEFQKQFKINYHDFGCTPPIDLEFYENYNRLVFEYLSKEYGKDWTASANQNAFGLKKWLLK